MFVFFVIPLKFNRFRRFHLINRKQKSNTKNKFLIFRKFLGRNILKERTAFRELPNKHYLSSGNNRHTSKTCEIYSKLTIKTRK